MDEENLRKHMFLNRVGVLSIQKNNRDFLKSLQYSSELLGDPNNLLTIYPSGVMFSQHQQTIHFQGGIDRILKGGKKSRSIVFAVFLVDYFGFARQEIRIYLENYTGDQSTDSLTDAYNLFYQHCVVKQTE